MIKKKEVLIIITEARVTKEKRFVTVDQNSFYNRYLDVFDYVIVIIKGEDKEFFWFKKGKVIYLALSWNNKKMIFTQLLFILKKFKNYKFLIRFPGPLAYVSLLFRFIFRLKFKYALEVTTDPHEEINAMFFKRTNPVIRKFVNFFIKIIIENIFNKSSLLSFVTESDIQSKFNFNKTYSSYTSLNIDEKTFISKKNILTKYNNYEILKNLIFVGSFHGHLKGFDLLIEAISNIQKNESLNFSLDVIGDGPNLEKYKTFVKDNNIENITFHGFIKDRLIIEEFIKKSYLLILPSRREGLPRVLIESSAWGTASIASDVSGVKEIISSNAIFPKDNSKILEKLLIKCIINKKFVVELITEAREKVDIHKYSIVNKKRNIFYHKLKEC